MTTVTGATGSSGTTSTTNATSSDLTAASSKDKDLFLKLLVAQMKYQDPSNPTDPNQFLSQTAQYTTVEKLDALSVVSKQVYESSRQQTAASLVGRTVTFTDAAGKAQTGSVTGVSVGSSTPNLTVNGLAVSLDKVTAVGDPPPTASTGSNGTTQSG
jgi:flagellar basal-body rod modification protein FlgD